MNLAIPIRNVCRVENLKVVQSIVGFSVPLYYL